MEPLEKRQLFSAEPTLGTARAAALVAAVTHPKLVGAPQPTPTSLGGGWTEIFDDEFNGSSLNPVWHTAQYWDSTVTVGNGGEAAYAPGGVSVSNGKLHLTARKSTSYGEPYVSGIVNTGGEDFNPNYPSFSFLHGYMEVRAKLPAGQGLWPAIWLMPASHNDSNGEIDALEMMGDNPDLAYFTLHRDGNEQQMTSTGINLSSGYHTYGVDWEANFVSFYIDGKLMATITDTSLICPEAAYPIIDLAVGGWDGPPNPRTHFPATAAIDYVRIWQQDQTTA
jgi:beta-glucanase (GH16 family)